MTWHELIDRLLIIANEKGLQPSWVVTTAERCGGLPWAIYRKLAFNFCYSIDWVNGKWQPQRETPQPDTSAIDWETT
jgi:hypothetical protein